MVERKQADDGDDYEYGDWKKKKKRLSGDEYGGKKQQNFVQYDWKKRVMRGFLGC